MNERWKDIKEFEEIYQVSNLGRVKSLERTNVYIYRRYGTVCKRKLPEKILVPCYAGAGYMIVGLCKNNKVTSCYVHRLVWETFIGAIPVDMEINHSDGNKENNKINNLEVKTHAQNIQHAFDNKLSTPFGKGETNIVAKLDENTVLEIRRRLTSGEVQRRIAEDIGVCYQTITNIKLGTTWSHI